MPYKTVLVSLNDLSRQDAMLSVSTSLASRHGAHLIGLYVIPAPRVYPGLVPAGGPTVIDSFRVFFEKHRAATKAAFEKAVDKSGIEAEWRVIESSSPDIADEVVEHGFQAEIIIASQNYEESGVGIGRDFCASIVMGSGGPVLLIPKNGAFSSVGDSVVVGWNATRESARAIFDALPVLEKANETRLIWIDPQDDSARAGDLPGSEMAATLARRGVYLTTEDLSADEIETGEALISRAREVGADLIVAGAYGHSRMREFIFGGVTQTLLHHMTVPVLFSH